MTDVYRFCLLIIFAKNVLIILYFYMYNYNMQRCLFNCNRNEDIVV